MLDENEADVAKTQSAFLSDLEREFERDTDADKEKAIPLDKANLVILYIVTAYKIAKPYPVIIAQEACGTLLCAVHSKSIYRTIAVPRPFIYSPSIDSRSSTSNCTCSTSLFVCEIGRRLLPGF